ncbi:zinc finger protein-like [Hetaerina americana]|uniref:zinc finger protein-like n=1 Tax=Hetaerina americana TaxID=62018 RepID=UPI003A7F4892
MCDKIDFVVCRLCLNSGGELINIFDEHTKTEFMLEKTIEDLVNVKVVEDKRYPWLVCSTCMEKLTEFRLFKHRCAECLFVFYNRIRKRSKSATKDWITNREEEVSDVLRHDNKGVEKPGEDLVDGTSDRVWALSSAVESVEYSVRAAMVETDDSYRGGARVNWMAENNCRPVEIQFPGGIKREIDDDTITSDAIDMRVANVRDDMVVVKKEIDTASGCSGSLGGDIDSSMVPSMQEAGSHQLDNEKAGNLDRLGDDEFIPSLNVDVEIKEECDVDIPQGEGVLQGKVLEGQGGDQGQHGPDKDGAGNFQHTCQICKQEFAEKDILKAHMIRGHPVNRSQPRGGVRSKTYRTKCDSDPSVYTRRRKYQCQHCRIDFTLKRDLRRHLLTHSDVCENKCEICSREFSLKRNLKRHMLLHTGERPYKCGICSKDYSSKGDLNRHMLIHTGERPHKCNLCTKSFKYKQHLEGHVLTHISERPHKCEMCSKGFIRKRDLEMHVLIHSGQTPFRCEICSKTFRYKSNLRRHIIITSGETPQKCDVCSMVFHDRRGLTRHLKAHSGSSRLQCYRCNFTSISKRVLRQHLIEAH